MELMPKVHLIKSIVANMYLIVDDHEIALVDTGMPGNEKNIAKYLATLHLDMHNIKTILITHADADHYGSVSVLHERSNASVCASSVEADAIQQGQSSRQLKPKGLETVLYTITGLFFKAPPCPIIGLLTPGDILPIFGGLQVIDSAGHTPGHISLFSAEKKVLFAGDSIWIKKGTLVPSSGANCWDPEKAVKAFESQMALQPRLICMGHGLWRATNA